MSNSNLDDELEQIIENQKRMIKELERFAELGLRLAFIVRLGGSAAKQRRVIEEMYKIFDPESGKSFKFNDSQKFDVGVGELDDIAGGPES